ncbi:MAG: FecR family protein [Flavobacteriaceae bacterium]|nr:FecR family protein [Flavobacteriaceae bacterium]
MTREALIKKWLDNALDAKETEAFKKLGDYEQLTKLSESLKQFKAPEYNTSEELKRVLSQLNSKKKKKRSSTLKQLVKIAAIIVLGFSVVYYSSTLDTTLTTDYAEHTTIELPDASWVTLNAKSELTYNKHNWNKQREISLRGEAYFKVSNGASFNVKTASGTVTVIGTEFNVKQRRNIFEVTCYEGSVKVVYQDKNSILNSGDNFSILDGKLIAKEKETAPSPSWLNNESYFKSMPLNFVLNEFERQFELNFDTKDINVAQLFTGSFTHKDVHLALKSITLPLNLKYSIKDNTIVLTRE